MVVYYCKKCGFVSDPDVGMKNRCPGCGDNSMHYLDGSLNEILNHVSEHRAVLEQGAQKTSTNIAMDAIAAIKGALRIKTLWMPPKDDRIIAENKHYEEYVALKKITMGRRTQPARQ